METPGGDLPAKPVYPRLETRNRNAVRYLNAKRRHQSLVQERLDGTLLSGSGSDQNRPGGVCHADDLVVKNLMGQVEALRTVMAVHAIARELAHNPGLFRIVPHDLVRVGPH